MSYPRNAASPPGIFFRLENLAKLPVESGASVFHIPSGGARASASGVLTHRGAGVWEYVPTQSETNHETFCIQLYDAGVCNEVQWVVTTVDPAGSGARAVTITVDDGSDPLEGAFVRVARNGDAETFTRTTDASGECSLSLDDGTWTVSITLAGYTFTPTSLVVDGTEDETYSMTQVVTPGGSPDQVKGYIYCYKWGVPEEGATVTIWVDREGATDGYAYADDERTGTADATGLVEFTGLHKGVTYKYRRGSDTREFEVTIPTDAGDPYELDSIVGD